MNDDSKSRSRERAKDTAIEAAGIGVASVVDSGALSVMALFKTGYKHFKRFAEERAEGRRQRFAQYLLDNHDERHTNAPMLPGLEPSEFYAILKCVSDDEEDEKVEVYAALVLGLYRHHVDPRLRRFCIKSVASITFEEILLLAKAVEASRSKGDRGSTEGPSNLLTQILKRVDPLTKVGVQNLVRWNLIDNESKDIPWPTQIASELIKILGLGGMPLVVNTS